MTDAAWMRRALFHARRAVGVTTPNPMVGAVIVDHAGVVVGQGRHPRAGDPHAEVHAVREAGDRARGATLYVTLEPCCHQGRTGPCTDLLIAAGIRRVVAPMADPNPAVNGRGFEQLRAAGIQVDVGLLAEEAARVNRAFVIVHTRRRPMVIVKAATSLDARIAARPGERTFISSEPANRRTHRLRASVDAIGVGIGTLLVDDPVLTARGLYRERPFARVVFDRRLRTPPGARVFSTLDAGPVIILAGPADGDGRQESGAGIDERRRRLEDVGATVVHGDGDLAQGLTSLLEFDVSSLLVEGGARLHAALWQAGLVDRVNLVVAPVRLGDAGVKLFDGLPVPFSRMTPRIVEMVGPDAWMEADVHGNH